MKTSNRKWIFLCLMLVAGVGVLRSETRTLTDVMGRTIKADVVEVQQDTVKIRRDDGRIFEMPLNTLSERDQAELKAWAASEATKPKANVPVAVNVQMSRAKFDTESITKDVTLVGGDVVKKGQTITEEKWGYGVMITNQANEPLNDLHVEYLLFATIDDLHAKGNKEGLRRKNYRTKLDPIAAKGRLDFRTETVSAFKTKFNGNIRSVESGASTSRETLYGIWLRLYRGTELVYETASPEGLRKSETWPKD